MCQVSDKIKFCICNVKDINDLLHYWVFHSYNEDLDLMVMGQPIMPAQIDEETDMINKKALLKRVNERDAFDVELYPKEKDRLQLSFTCFELSDNGMIHYGFEFRNGRWEEEDYELFDWMMKHEERDFGEISPAIQDEGL